MLFNVIKEHGHAIQAFLQKQQYPLKDNYQYDLQDKRLQQLLVSGLNSDDEQTKLAAEGLFGLGVRLPKFFVLNDYGVALHTHLSIKISEANKELMTKQQKVKMQNLTQVMRQALAGEQNAVKGFMSALYEIQNADAGIPAPSISSAAFQGGGPRGACYNGVSTALEQLEVTSQLQTVIGSSAGAITAFGFALGFDAKQFAAISSKLDFQDLLDAGGSYIYAPWYKYVYTGENFHHWARMVCQEILGNPDATFGDLNKAISDPNNPYHHPGLKHLVVTGTQLLSDGTSQTVAFSSKNENTFNVKLADAIRASMSIPGVYKPWTIVGTDGKNWGTFVDGGVLNNFPINLLDDRQFSNTHLGIKYDLVQMQSVNGPVQVNPCSMGFTFVDDLSELDPKITPVTEHLQSECNRKKINLKQPNTPKPAEDSSIGVSSVTTQIYQAYYGQRKAESLSEKYSHHPGNVVQMYPEGIGLLDFNAEKKLIDRAAQTAKESTLLTLKQKDPTTPYQGKVEIEDLPLSYYLTLLNAELRKHGQPELQEYYDLRKLKDNLTVQFIVKKIIQKSESRPDKSISAEDYLSSHIAKALESKNASQRLVARFNQRVNNLIDDTESLKMLQSMILADGSKNKEFISAMQGQLTRVIEQCSSPIDTEGGKTLLQVAIARGNYELLEKMLEMLGKAYVHRQEQKKPPVQGKGFSDIVNRINGGLLNSVIRANIDDNKKELCFNVLKEKANCNPLEQNAAGLTPLHVAVESGKPEILTKLLKEVSEKVYLNNYSTHHLEGNINSKESLFEYILRRANPQYLIKMFDDQDAFQKLYYYKQVCATEFTMEETLAKYTLEHNCPEVWDAYHAKYYGKADPNQGYRARVLVSVEQKEKSFSQKQQQQQDNVAKQREYQDKFKALFAGENHQHNLIDMQRLQALSSEDLKVIIGMSFQENSDANGLNLLCNACRMGQFDAVKLIVEKLDQPPGKANILNFLTEKSRDKAPLVWAIEGAKHSPEGARKIVELLIGKGVVGNFIHTSGSKDEPCAITLAAKEGHNDLVSLLFPHIVTRQSPDSDKRTLLHYLAENPETTPEQFHSTFYKNFGVAGYNFPKLNTVDALGKTPFHYLIENNRIDVFEYMLKTSIPRGTIGWSSSSPITLTECGVFIGNQDVNKADFYSKLTLLEYAVLLKRVELSENLASKLPDGIKLLTSAKAKVSSEPVPDVEAAKGQKRVSPMVIKRAPGSPLAVAEKHADQTVGTKNKPPQ